MSISVSVFVDALKLIVLSEFLELCAQILGARRYDSNSFISGDFFGRGPSWEAGEGYPTTISNLFWFTMNILGDSLVFPIKIQCFHVGNPL